MPQTPLPLWSRECRGPCDHFKEHGSEAEHIASRVCFLSPRLLWRHVSGCSHDSTRSGCVGALLSLCRRDQRKTEIHHLHRLVAAQHDVFRLNVTVDNTGAMSGSKHVRTLQRNPNGVFQAESAGAQFLPKGGPLDELGRDEPSPVRLADFVNRHRVGVLQRRGSSGLTLKTRHAREVVCQLRVQDFERYVPLQCFISGSVYLAR